MCIVWSGRVGGADEAPEYRTDCASFPERREQLRSDCRLELRSALDAP
jgi:hypothetical protein